MIRVAFLFFDMNSYFASVAQQEEPALIGRPVGVLTTDAPGAACIAASYEAKVRGVKMGTRQAEARRLCPGIVFRPALHDVYVRYHHAIRAAAERVIPIGQAHSVDEFSCYLQGSQQDLNTALQIAADVQASILRQVGPAMRCSVGVAPTRLLAKIAAELHKPMGINWLHPDVMPGKIAHLRLKDIPGLSRGMVPRLERAGITDVSRLYAMTPKQARHLWKNVMGERFMQELQGTPAHWPRSKGKSIGHGQVLAMGNRSPAGARLVVRRLLVKAAARLRREGKYAGSLYLGVKCRRHGWLKHFGSIGYTRNTLELLQILERYWQALPIEDPKSVNVMLGRLIGANQHTVDLFTPTAGTADRQEKLCHMIDALNRRYGRDTVRFG